MWSSTPNPARKKNGKKVPKSILFLKSEAIQSGPEREIPAQLRFLCWPIKDVLLNLTNFRNPRLGGSIHKVLINSTHALSLQTANEHNSPHFPQHQEAFLPRTPQSPKGIYCKSKQNKLGNFVSGTFKREDKSTFYEVPLEGILACPFGVRCFP